MLTNALRIIPRKSLPRFQGDKRIWLKPVKFEVEKIKNGVKISFLSTRGIGRRRFSETIPKIININDKFKTSLVAYMCEGTNLRKGIYTENSGNKGKNISFSNNDPWLVKLIVDEFQKIGVSKNKWKVRLTLYSQHIVESERNWWSNFLNIQLANVKVRKRLQGEKIKSTYALHGGCIVEIYSVIFSALIDNLINLIKNNKL
jgi:hypothetical protein